MADLRGILGLALRLLVAVALSEHRASRLAHPRAPSGYGVGEARRPS